jgi:threonine/homoserine/homoserine lactone efflux protein
MTLSTYLVYLAAVLLLIVTPGPTMLMCMTNAANHGPARAMASLGGALTAAFTLMGLSALGLGALLAASEAAFTVLKVLGAAYLVWLGVKTYRNADPLPEPTADGGRGRALYVQGLLVGFSNPKALLFFAAFFPQFIDPAAAFWPQFFILSLTFVLGDFIVMLMACLGVGRIAPWLRQSHVVRWTNRVCGGLFALMGGLLLFSRRST